MKPLILSLAIIFSSFIQSFAVAPITGTPNVCVGLTTPLADATPGGVWSSSDVSIAEVGSVSGIVAGIVAGTVTITYTVGSAYAVASFSVNPTPDPISGITTICLGASSTLTDIDTGGAWSSSNALTAPVGATSGIVSGLATGIATITFTLPTGCINSVGVTVYPNPAAITGASTICTGASATLTDGSGGGAWSSSDAAVATISRSSGLFTGASSGTAIITYMISTGCFTTASVAVVPAPGPISGSFALCAGSTVTLTDGSGGTWASSNTAVGSISSSGALTGVSAGTTTITYSFGSTCRATHEVTVYGVPAAIIGASTVCVGAATILEEVIGGGTWSSSDAAVATISTSTGVLSGASLGTAIITYELSTGCFTTASVAVVPAPGPISGSFALCAGSTVTLTDGSGGTWASSNTAVGSISSGGALMAVSAGTTTISYSLGSGCRATHEVTVYALPGAITGPGAVCTGGTATLADTISGGSWISANTATGTINATGVVTGIAAGTDIITYYTTAGCQATDTIAIVTAPDAITAGTSALATGFSETLTDLTVGGIWTSSNTAMATVGSLTGVVTAGFIGGTVTITYSIGSGCASTYTLFIIPEGISNLNAPHAIVVYPNPATNELTIQATPMAYSAYSITNETGVQITTGNITNAQTIVNVATLSPGLYFISLTGPAGRTVQRFLKE